MLKLGMMPKCVVVFMAATIEANQLRRVMEHGHDVLVVSTIPQMRAANPLLAAVRREDVVVMQRGEQSLAQWQHIFRRYDRTLPSDITSWEQLQQRINDGQCMPFVDSRTLAA